MSVFSRALEVGPIVEHVKKHPEGAIASLFDHWVVPGQRPKREGRLGLRLAIRNGYVNFYVRGQSVAKLNSSKRKFSVETHWKYVQGVENGAKAEPAGRLYPSFAGDRLDELGEIDVVKWAKTAETYADAEKTFVDRLLISNPNSVDIEAALPGKTAIRMDLAVAFERDGKLAVGFWEAKCIDNKELRASTVYDPETQLGGPHVFKQARDYSTWLEHDEQRQQLQRAYQETGRIYRELVNSLVELDEPRFWHLTRLDKRVLRLADAPPDVVTKPGLVVGAYCPVMWVRRRPNPQADVAKFAGRLRSYRDARRDHEGQVQRYFSNYVCVENAGGHRLPELVD